MTTTTTTLRHHEVEIETTGAWAGLWAVRYLRYQDCVGVSKTYGWYATESEAFAVAAYLDRCSW